MVTSAKTFLIKGQLREEITKFPDRNQSFAQIIVRGDVEFDGREYPDAWILMLEMNGNIDAGWQCRSLYSHIFPRLLPVENFRRFLISELTRIRDARAQQRSPTCILWMGIGNYLRELEGFSEEQALLSQGRELFENLSRGLRSNATKSEAREDFFLRIREFILRSGETPVTEAIRFRRRN